jgi:hypothetical protein
MEFAFGTRFRFLLVISMTWKSALGLTLAPFASSLFIVIAFAPVQQNRQGLRSVTADYALLNAQEINHQTFKAATALKSK